MICHCSSSAALNISMPTGICPSSRTDRIAWSRSSFKSSYVELMKTWYFLIINPLTSPSEDTLAAAKRREVASTSAAWGTSATGEIRRAGRSTPGGVGVVERHYMIQIAGARGDGAAGVAAGAMGQPKPLGHGGTGPVLKGG